MGDEGSPEHRLERKNANENESYNLAGQRIGKDYGGFKIQKGRKMVE